MSWHEELLDWYRANRRDLPWRRTSDPYAIWVSEVMLQQTQVATVIGYFERWMKRFPTLQSLAEANIDDVLVHWQGLGYYSRARNLQKGASRMLMPDSNWTAAFLEKYVPGIGRYTAAAIASISQGEPVPLVDGNVERVFARLTGFDEPKPMLTSAAWDWAAQNLQFSAPGDWNQALMELGATICTPKSPHCPNCPVSSACISAHSSRANSLPTPSAKPKTVRLQRRLVVQVVEGRVKLVKIPDGKWAEGMYEFPELSESELQLPLLISFSHSVTHHRIRIHAYLAESDLSTEGAWFALNELHELAMPSPQRKIATAVQKWHQETISEKVASTKV